MLTGALTRIRPLIRSTFLRSHRTSVPSTRRLSTSQNPTPSTPPDQDFVCDEEPNDLPSEEGFGYLPILPGQELCDGRFQVVRKLGWGLHSTVWLANEPLKNRYVAIKATTAYATALHSRGIFDEIQLLERIRSANPHHPGFQHCCQLIETFNATSSYGEHVCLVTEALGMDLGVYRSHFNRRMLPVRAVKRITKQTLLALDYLHRECGIIHTDLKPENAMLAPPTSHDAITRHLEKFPPELYPSHDEGSISDDSIITVKSQPLPVLDVSADGSNISIKIGDFGHSSWVHKQLREEIQPEALRAPEVIIGDPWSTPADIWSLGCLTFEYLKGIPLFNSLDEFKGVSPVDLHLLRILQVSSDSEYPKDMIARSSRREGFFTAEGRLRRVRTGVKTDLEEPLRGSQIPENEIKPAVAFIQRCIRIRPEDRATAQELLSDPWLEG